MKFDEHFIKERTGHLEKLYRIWITSVSSPVIWIGQL